MKKRLFLFVLAMISLVTIQAQTQLFVGGYVTDLSGNAIANHTVYIQSDSIGSYVYHSAANTNQNGYYSFTIPNIPSPGTLVHYYLWTNDCNGQFIDTSITNNSPQQVVNFNICTSTTSLCQNSFTHTHQGLTYAFSGHLNSSLPTTYKWNFGDGTMAIGQNVTHTFTQPVLGANGYNVCLVTISGSSTAGNLCIDTTCQFIPISNTAGTCAASFNWTNNSSNNNTVSFLNTSTTNYPNAQIQYFWNFGDGTTSTLTNPVHTYQPSSAIQNFSVSLTMKVLDSAGSIQCQNAYNYTITIYNTISGCQNYFTYTHQGMTYTFKGFINSSSSTTYTWLFSDGSVLTGQTITRSFTNPTPGTTGIQVCLITTTSNSFGQSCTDTSCQYINLANTANCLADFHYYADSAGNQNILHFVNNSLSAYPNAQLIYNWNFGDGTSSTQTNPTHTFPVNPSGNGYNVCLVIKALDSSLQVICQDTSCKMVYPNSINTFCQNNFSYTNSGLTYSFTGQININYTTTYFWKFGDGSTGNGQNVSHTFSQPSSGTNGYYVCLITQTTDNNGNVCTDTTCKFININSPSNCNVGFQYIIDSSAVHFTNYSTSGYPNAQISYVWNFGDGTSSSLENPTHIYSLNPTGSNSFNVCLQIIVKDSFNNILCQNTLYQTLTLANINNCQNHFTYTNQNLTYTFTGHVASSNQTIYSWSFGDGTHASGQTVTHTFAQPPTGTNGYTVSLATYEFGTYCSDSTWQFIQIDTTSTGSCNANFNWFADSISNPNNIHFLNNSTSGYPNAQISYVWNFGDGTSSSLENPTHIYSLNPTGSNSFNVCLQIIVKDSFNNILCQNTFCQTLTLANINNCQNHFTYTNQNLTYTFTGHVASSNQTIYHWNFGDGTTTYGQTVTHTFAQPATGTNGYTVCLFTITSNSNGTSCTDSTCQFISIGNTSGNTVQGYVYAGNYPANGYVLIYMANNATMSYNLIDTLALDSNGYYHFNSPVMPPVNPAFLVKAVLNPGSAAYNHYAPTFYQHSANWVTATPVFPASYSVYYNINLIPLPVINPGNGSITGNVSQTGTKSSVNVLGAEIILSDMNDSPVRVSYSDANGNFSFDNLPMGSYRIHLEIAGISYTPYPVTLSNINPGISNLSININNNGAVITGIENAELNQTSVGEFYPNPATDEVFINIQNVNNNNVNVTIYNQTGVKISSTEYRLSGTQRIALNSRDLSSGIYFVKIGNNNGLNTMRKLVISR